MPNLIGDQRNQINYEFLLNFFTKLTESLKTFMKNSKGFPKDIFNANLSYP